MFGISKQLLVALGLGAVALLLNQYYLSTQAEVHDLGPRVKVVVSKKDIRAGTMLTSSLMGVQTIPQKFAPKQSVRDPKEIEGQEVGVDIVSGDYITWTDIAGRRLVGNRLSEQVEAKDGARAYTIPVDELNSLSRSLTTGDRIDIVYIFNLPNVAQRISVVLLQNVPIIATGSYSVAEQERGEAGAGKRYGTVTLKLSAQDAMRLNYARQNGQINVLLRNPQDSAPLEVKPITSVQDVLNASERSAVENLSRSVQPDVDSMDRLRDQFRDLLEKQQRQTVKK
jgi:pilus assembly protein CpaB